MTTIHRTALATVFCLSLAAPVLAAGPFDGEFAAIWWANEFETDSDAGTNSTEGAAPGLRAQLWFDNRYGVKATQYGSDPADSDGADYTSLDVQWRPLSPTENNFFAVGLGWQQMEIAGLQDKTSGMRVSVEGRIDITGMIYAYGNAAYLPALEDSPAEDASFGEFEDLASHEYELGMAWNATPFVNIHAGYRVNTLDFNQNLLVPSGTGSGVSGVGSGGGSTDLVPGSAGPSCPDCEQQATFGQTEGSFETAGFFAGVGINF